MQIPGLFEQFDQLQLRYGDKNLNAIYGCGEINQPKLCLVFMNPTGRNVSADRSWTGLRAPWLGTRNIWKMFHQLSLFDQKFLDNILSRQPSEWDPLFAETVYKKVRDNSIYITNLAKATQVDARPLSNDIFRQYTGLFKQEIAAVKPQVIITFGNQVSSVLLEKNIKVSDHRKQHQLLKIGEVDYKVFPVYYPVGQGQRNVQLAREDIDWIMKNQIQEITTNVQ